MTDDDEVRVYVTLRFSEIITHQMGYNNSYSERKFYLRISVSKIYDNILLFLKRTFLKPDTP